MDIEYLQTQRYKLQKRFRRLNAARSSTYSAALRYFWQFLRDHELFSDIITQLAATQPDADELVGKITEGGEAHLGETEVQRAAIGLGLLKYCAETDNERGWLEITRQYTIKGNHDEAVRYFTEALIEPLYEYVDEQVDDRGATLALIRRYQRRSEWFERERLYRLWNKDTAKGEAHLAGDLYKYLYDQGVDFHIEPKSASGRVDLIDAQRGDHRLLADAKILNPGQGRGRSYLAEGVRQLYDYCVDFQQPVGYLVIFKTSDHDLRFVLEREDSQIPRIVYNHKTLFLLEVDIYPYEKPASERGKLEPFDVSEEDLLSKMEESSAD